jgi:flagellar assembly protein FliH
MSDPATRFQFDTEFSASGDVTFSPQRVKRLFPADEVEQIRAEAFAAGEQAALNSLSAQQANAISAISAACAQALPRLAEVAHEHRTASAELALACARAIAGAALDRFPEAVALAALDALAREIDAQPRLVVTAEPGLAKQLQDTLDDAARGLGFEGAVVVKGDGAFGAHAFTLDFGDGQATYDPAAAAERVSEVLTAALASEGLHAEPLIPGSES